MIGIDMTSVIIKRHDDNIDVKLANPLKTKAIAEARIKTDKLDARTLAHLLRSDLVAECYIANKKKVRICFLTATDKANYEILKRQYPSIKENCVIYKPVDNESLVELIKSDCGRKKYNSRFHLFVV